MLLQVLTQSPPDTSRRLADVVQYLTGAGIIALVVFCWRINEKLTRFESRILTILTEPELGIVARVQAQGTRSHTHGGKLQEHELRLDGHDRELARLSTALDADRRSGNERRVN